MICSDLCFFFFLKLEDSQIEWSEKHISHANNVFVICILTQQYHLYN